MSTFFVTRHKGAREWAVQNKLSVDGFVTHFDPDILAAGDTVIGTLPVQIIWEINRRGARYLHLSMDIPLALRGKELSAEDMKACGARLEEYEVRKVPM